MQGRIVQMAKKVLWAKRLSICITRAANEQNRGYLYQPYQPGIKVLHERITSLAAREHST